MKHLSLAAGCAAILVCLQMLGPGLSSAAATCVVQETESFRGNRTKKEAPKADESSAKKAYSALAKQMRKKNYQAASKLMTKAGFDEFCASTILEAGMMADPQFAPPAIANKINDIFEKYGIDTTTMPNMFEAEMASEKQRESHEQLLAQFENVKQRLSAIKELEKAMKPDGMNGNMIINISPFDGEIIGATTDGDVVTLAVKPSMPEGVEMMMGGPDGEMPEGVEILEADELPLGAIPMQGFELNEIPQGAEMQGMVMGGIPTMFFRLKKEGENWKWDGMDTEKMRANMEGIEMGFDIPTIENPEFTGTTLSGNDVSLKDYRGKLVLLDFWGTWCKPCVAELPKLKKLRAALENKGFEIIGIANDSRKDLEKFMQKTELTWENIVDADSEICEKFGIQAFPTTLLIDKEGNHFASNLHGNRLVNELAKRLNLSNKEKKAIKKILNPRSPQESEF